MQDLCLAIKHANMLGVERAPDAGLQRDISQLIALNGDCVDSVQRGDVRRFDEILADVFLCSNTDGSLVDKRQFLANGEQGNGRYTDVWARRDGSWLAVSAHVTR